MTCKGTSWRRSPVVSTNTSSATRPVAVLSWSATACACVEACSLPRVARRTARRFTPLAEVEQVAHRGRVALALGSAGAVAQPDRRGVEQLGDDRPGERVDGVPLGVVERRELGREPGELAGAHVLGLLMELGHERGGLARRHL